MSWPLTSGFFVFQDILTLEEQEGAVNFKFGVLYAKAGQKTDDEMFSNGKDLYCSPCEYVKYNIFTCSV